MFHIHSIGMEVWHDEDFRIDRKTGFDGFLLLCFRTKAVLYLGEEVIHVKPWTLLLFDRNTPQLFGADGEAYCDDFVFLDGSEDDIRPYAALLDKPIFVGERICLCSYFGLMSDAFYSGRGDRVFRLLLRALLEELLALTQTGDVSSAYYGALIELRKEIYHNPAQDWTVKAMAERLALSEAYLQDLYRRSFGVSCIADVISSRIEKAKNLLLDPSLSVTEVALRCGYNSTIHFSRQFKQQTGVSPSQYRRAHIPRIC